MKTANPIATIALVNALNATYLIHLARQFDKASYEFLMVQYNNELDRQASLKALEICQERMMQGRYANDMDAMQRDIERETVNLRNQIRH